MNESQLEDDDSNTRLSDEPAVDEVLESVAEAARAVGTRLPAMRVGFGMRLLAFVVDWVIQIVLLVILFLSGSCARWISGPGPNNTIETIGELCMSLLPSVYSVTEIFFRGTPGKRLTDLQIARADGYRATTHMLVNRWACKNGALAISSLLGAAISVSSSSMFSSQQVYLVYAITVLIQLVICAGCFAVLFPGRRALHDYIAGSAIYTDNDVTRVTAAARGFEVEIPIAKVAVSSDDVVSRMETR